jgi:hypothetical protein
MTSSGIKPMTCWLVVQCLNQLQENKWPARTSCFTALQRKKSNSSARSLSMTYHKDCTFFALNDKFPLICHYSKVLAQSIYILHYNNEICQHSLWTSMNFMNFPFPKTQQIPNIPFLFLIKQCKLLISNIHSYFLTILHSMISST